MKKRKKIFFIILFGMFYCQSLMAARVFIGSYAEGLNIYDMYYDDADCRPPLMCEPTGCTYVRSLECPMCPGYWIPRSGCKAIYNENSLALNNKTNFNISFDENLQIIADNDATAKVYELVSGKSIADNLHIIQNNKIILNNIEKNKHYVILFETSDGIQEEQIFFINNNQLYKGGK